MTRAETAAIGERIVRVETKLDAMEDALKGNAADMKEAAGSAKADRAAMHQKMDAILSELREDREDSRSRDIATNSRIDAYENQAKGSWKTLALLGSLWSVVSGAAGAAFGYWIKSGMPK